VVDAGQDLHRIGLASLRGMAAASGRAAFDVAGEIGDVDWQSRRATIDHATDRRAVAFAESGDTEQVAEGVVRHRARLTHRTPPSGLWGRRARLPLRATAWATRSGQARGTDGTTPRARRGPWRWTGHGRPGRGGPARRCPSGRP